MAERSQTTVRMLCPNGKHCPTWDECNDMGCQGASVSWDDDPPVVRRLREALQQALPGLRDLVNQQCSDPDVAERDKRVLALALEALEIT